MDGLVFTPKRTDFLKDGSIFAQSPASTSHMPKPHVPGSENPLRPALKQTAVRNPQGSHLHALQPRTANGDSLAQAIWAPQPVRSSSTAAFGQTDMAAQIRAKFENLVRASPLPKVVEQLVSPGGFSQQPKCSSGLSRESSRPPAWQTTNLPASTVAMSGFELGRGLSDTALQDAASAGPECQVSLEARLVDSQQGQLNAYPVSHSRQLAATTSAFPDSSLTLHHAAVHGIADAAVPHTSIGLPAAQQSLQQQHTPHVPEALNQGGEVANAYATADQAPIGPQISHQPGSRGSESDVNCGQQQAPPGQSNQSGADAGRDEPGAQTQQEVTVPAENVMLGQESSSMMSLSPSLKLDIPGLDDMLDTHMLSENEDQAVSPPSPAAQQQHSLILQDAQQQGIEQQQPREHQGELPLMQDVAAPPADGQALGMHPTAISASCAHGRTSQPMPSDGYPEQQSATEGSIQDPSSHQPGQASPQQQPVASNGHLEQQSAAEGISQDPCTHQLGQACPPQHAELSQPDTATAQLAGVSQPAAAAAAADDDDDNGSQQNISAGRQGLQPVSSGNDTGPAMSDRSPAGPLDVCHADGHHTCAVLHKADQPGLEGLKSNPEGSSPQVTDAAVSGPTSQEKAVSGLAVSSVSKPEPSHNHSSGDMPSTSAQTQEADQGGSNGQDVAAVPAPCDLPAMSQQVDMSGEKIADALHAMGQHSEAAEASLQVAEQGEGPAASQEGLESSLQTSTTTSKKGAQQKRRQPVSSAGTGPPSKRRCVVTRSSQGGQVQPLLTAPTDVTWQDKKGLYETSRSGRVRYPPLAFWMCETKVHDRLGGAIAIERPGGTRHPPAHPIPPQPAAPAPTRTHSRPPQSQTKAQTQSVSQAHSKSHAKPDAEPQPLGTHSQSEVQSESQAQSHAPGPETGCTNAKPPSGKPRQRLPVQHSRRQPAGSAQPAVSVPQDPPSPPFPYPILAGRSAKAKAPAAAPSSAQQASQVADSPGKVQPQRLAAARQESASGTKKAQAGKTTNAALVQAGAAEASGVSKSKAAALAAGGGTAAAEAAGGKPAGPVGTAKLKRCGTCKTCMRPLSKQGCLVLRAVREQAPAAGDAAAASPLKPAGPAQPGKAAKGSQSTAAGNPKKQAVQSSLRGKATGSQAAASGRKSTQLDAETGSPGTQPNSKESGEGKASRSAVAAPPSKGGMSGSSDRQLKGRKSAGIDKAGEVLSGPSGSIHSALTQAVELASDAEQQQGDEQQQEAAEVLDSLKNSPVAPSPSHPVAPGVSAVACEPGSDQAMQSEQSLAGSPEQAAAKQKKRGRPRKERQPGEESDKLPAGPKRGRGRPRKTPAPTAEPTEEALAEGTGLQLGGSSEQAQVPSEAVEAVGAQQQSDGQGRPAAAQAEKPVSSKAPPTKIKVEKLVSTKGKQTEGSRPQAAYKASPSGAGSLPTANGQPSTSGRSPAAAAQQGWTEDQKAALQRAYLTVKPSQRNFWQHVAKLVPGKTALECCNSKFDELPTPVEKVKPSRTAAARDASPVRPPALKIAGGRIKKPTAAATKQWARQVRWQQRAQEQSDTDSPQPSAQPSSHQQQRSKLGNTQRGSATATLLAAIHKQDKADKYIDRILRKQGGRLHKLKAAPVASASLQAGKVHQHGSRHATDGLMAELQALGRQQPVDDDMYESEQDHYFSEDDT